MGQEMPMEQAPMEQGGQEQMEGGQPQEGGSPEEQIMMIAQDIISQFGPEGAAMLAQVIMQMLQEGGGQQEQPVFQRNGGRLLRKR